MESFRNPFLVAISFLHADEMIAPGNKKYLEYVIKCWYEGNKIEVKAWRLFDPKPLS